MAQPKYAGHFTVTEASGYTYEAPQESRVANSYGDDMTRLPIGHLARRDVPANVKHARRGSDDG
jgi:hypothetical protein